MENTKDNIDSTVDASQPSTKQQSEVKEYTKIKSALATLDKFLAKKFMLILGTCLFGISICGAGLFFNNTIGALASDGSGGALPGGSTPINAVLFSLAGVLAFTIVVTCVYALTSRRRRHANGNRISASV
jgi:hypothetical protein